MAAERLVVNLEFARAEEAGDSFAFRQGVQEYLLRADDGSYTAATLRWDDELLAGIAALRDAQRDPALFQRLGERLRRFLADMNDAAVLPRIEAALDAGAGVDLVLTSSAAELYALPWELLVLGRSGRHLGELADVSIRYRWPGAHPAPPARVPPLEGAEVVVAWSHAFGNVGEVRTIETLAAAARAGGLAFDPARDVVADVALPALVAALERRRGPAVVLHLLCHGAPLPGGAGYGLGLDDGRGGREVVDAGALRRALAPLAGQVRLVVLAACDSGNPGPAGAQLGSVAQELHRAGVPAVVAARYPVRGSAALMFTQALYDGLFLGTCSVEQAFARARARLARQAAGDWACLQLYSHAPAGGETRPVAVRPYRGLLAFEREHARFFFGRDAPLAEALADFAALVDSSRERLLVVTGAGGSGKSSLVLAGMHPGLERRGWAVAVMRPGRAPLRALDEALARRVAGQRFVVVVDQFEEVFTHGLDRGARDEALAFVRRLWDMSREPGRDVAVILTLRVDYLGRCEDVPLDAAGARLGRIAYDEAHRVFVAQMDRSELTQAIERPAAEVGLRLQPGLRDRLLAEIGDEASGLPLLSYALDELWLRRGAADELTHAALDAIGGVQGALARHADATIDGLDPAAQLQARRVFVRVVTFGGQQGSGVRRREPEDELRPRRDVDAFDRAVTALIAARLLVRRIEADGSATLEVAHEALIRHWQRLWRWYEADRDQLAIRAELDKLVEQWRQYGPIAGPALSFAQTIAVQLGDEELSDDAARMLRTSAALARRRRVARLASLAVTGLALVAVTLVMWRSSINAEVLRAEAVSALARAQEQEALAVHQRGLAEQAAAREMAAATSARVAGVQLLLHQRPDVAAAELLKIGPEAGGAWTRTALAALHAPLPRWVVDVGPTIPTAAQPLVAHDPPRLVVARDGGKIDVVSLTDGDTTPLTDLAGPIHGLEVARVDDDETIAVLGAARIELWLSRAAGITLLGRADLGERNTKHRLFLGANHRFQPAAAILNPIHPATCDLFAMLGDTLTRAPRIAGCLGVDPEAEVWMLQVPGGRVGALAWPGRGHSTASVGDAGDVRLADFTLEKQGLVLTPDVERAGARMYVWSTADRRYVPVRLQGEPIAEPAVTRHALHTIVRGGADGQICAAPLDGRPPNCDVPEFTCRSGAAFVGEVAGDVALHCHDAAVLYRDDGKPVQVLRGPPSEWMTTDRRGLLVRATDRGQLWVWDLRDRPSGVTPRAAPAWTALASRRGLHLADGRVRVAALAHAADGLRLWREDHPLDRLHTRPDDPTPRDLPGAAPLAAAVFAGDHFMLRFGARLIAGDFTTGTPTWRDLAGMPSYVTRIALAASGARALVLAEEPGTLYVLDLAAPATARPITHDAVRGAAIVNLAIDPAGTRGAAVLRRGATVTTVLIDLTDLATRTLPWPAAALAFSSTGRLALAEPTGTIHLIDLTNRDNTDRDHTPTLTGPRSPRALSFSADGHALTSLDDRTVAFWPDLAAPTRFDAELPRAQSPAQALLDPTTRRLFVLSDTGALYWFLAATTPTELAAALDEHVTPSVRQALADAGPPRP